jgi:hypothetical protein
VLGDVRVVGAHTRRTVELLTEDVSVAGVPVRLGQHLHKHRVQGDIRPWPPRDVARCVCRQLVDGQVRMQPDASVPVDDLSTGLGVCDPHVDLLLGSLVQQGRSSANGRSKVLPKYQASTMDKCLTNPSRLVHVGVSGRRTSYEESFLVHVDFMSGNHCHLHVTSSFSGFFSGVVLPAIDM